MADNSKAIAAVNHWRGQCLDSFARVEHEIILLLERWIAAEPKTAPTLAESAAARTRNLVAGLKKHRSSDDDAKDLVQRLEYWTYREKQRNELVHGQFNVESEGTEWVLINVTRAIKKQISTERKELMTSAEAKAFLTALRNERRAIVSALSNFQIAPKA